MSQNTIDAARLRRLSWRARRGLLENDLIFERFFAEHATELDEELVHGLDLLLDLTDNVLLDLLLERSEPSGELDQEATRRVLAMLRRC